MKRTQQIQIYLNGKPIAEMSPSALDFIPAVGSIIHYQQFRENPNMPLGEKLTLKVEAIEYFTEESWNQTYKDKTVIVYCTEKLIDNGKWL